MAQPNGVINRTEAEHSRLLPQSHISDKPHKNQAPVQNESLGGKLSNGTAQETRKDKRSEVEKKDNIDPTAFLKRQIQLLETNDEYETKLRYESEAYVLRKRRNYLFRSYQKGQELQERPSREQGAIIFDQQTGRKKVGSKNSVKIQKLLNSFINKTSQEQTSNQYLQFISQKHKIPIEVSKKTVNTQIGYSQVDIRKVKKYQVDINKLPILGLTCQLEDKKVQENNQEDLKAEQKTNFECLQVGKECFEQKIQQKGYKLPEHPLRLQFLQGKREIFKVARQLTRIKQERENQCKKIAYLCMKEVEKKYIKSIRTQNQSVLRAKKLHRECLIYWRKRQKDLNEVKKKKEKLQAQLKKREQEQQQAKKQEKRLQYIMYQSGLYSHFMATKLGVEGDQKKQLEDIAGPKNPNVQIDEEAAQLTVNQIINNKQQNLEKFSKPQLDLSSVDQGKLKQLVGTPASFNGQLKQYQIKGLRWLNNLFQQGINGILADEMGLGKTIQAIALLAHVSHTKNVWGPFLIVAPNSTLFNWQQEFKKFCPSLKVLPYWGNIKQRKTLRKFFSSKKFTQKPDSPFHVVITSYQLTVTDDKVFKKMKWQFMILDEAQAIKNVMSQRWTTLKEFQSRNRLLLTGTPIQNNMAQLWALLNFVMPDLFDSHELFNEWFSKDIQAHSQDAKELDQIKIQRLHAILKPFMLRRVKKDVQHEIGKKIQHKILCQMTKRQKLLYESIKERLNVKELFKMFDSKAKVENLMNLVMQLRKVCNHPQLFERRPPTSPFLFQDVYYYTGYIPIRAGDIKLLSFSSHNPIKYSYPKLAYDQFNKYQTATILIHKKFLNIYAVPNQQNNPTFSITRLMGLSAGEIQTCFRQDKLTTAIILAHWIKNSSKYAAGFSTQENLIHIIDNDIDQRFLMSQRGEFQRAVRLAYIPAAEAPAVELDIASSSYYNNEQLRKNNKFHKFVLYGDYKQRFSQLCTYKCDRFNQQFKGILKNHSSLSRIQVINFGKLIADSSKLKELDKILKEKKKNGDKVLIFCQMTKMIDILEDFMNMRNYSFFRLDGACNIADRRDMVNEFQKSTSKTFVFLLSTRAGGLGVTLTAANTVIFYDNDWNPTMDAQATDRAHRIGQSRDVNVYQLVTKGTIQERIVKRAQQKKTVQSTVYEGASFNFFKKDMILQLMADQFDENGVALQEKSKKQGPKKRGKPSKQKQENSHEHGYEGQKEHLHKEKEKGQNKGNKQNEIKRGYQNPEKETEQKKQYKQENKISENPIHQKL